MADTPYRCQPFPAPLHSRIVVLNCGVVAIDFLPVLSMCKASEGFLLKNEDKITISWKRLAVIKEYQYNKKKSFPGKDDSYG